MTNNEKGSRGAPGGIEEGYIDRLAEFWPEPREQLHFGGWKATYELVTNLNLAKAECSLDLCCGEGSTAVWLAKTYHRLVFGVDILENAINVARNRAEEFGVSDLARFKVADIFALPFPDNHFDVIYGQDPDGLAHKDRVGIFQECKRVLRPKGRIGFQLWLPHADMTAIDLAFFEKVTADFGYRFMTRISVNDFLSDLKISGFTNIQVEDVSSMYQQHVVKMKKIHEDRKSTLDMWHAMLLNLYKKGNKIGVRIFADID